MAFCEAQIHQSIGSNAGSGLTNSRGKQALAKRTFMRHGGAARAGALRFMLLSKNDSCLRIFRLVNIFQIARGLRFLSIGLLHAKNSHPITPRPSNSLRSEAPKTRSILMKANHSSSPPRSMPATKHSLIHLQNSGSTHIACRFKPGCEGCTGGLCHRQCRSGDAGFTCVLPAVEEYGAKILTECEVTKIESDPDRATGIRCVHEGKEMLISGKVIVLAAGAYMPR